MQSSSSATWSRTLQEGPIERRREPGRAGVVDDLRAAIGERCGQVAAHCRQAEVVAEIARAEGERDQTAAPLAAISAARAIPTQVSTMAMTATEPGRDPVCGLGLRDQPVEAAHVLQRLGLGQDDRVEIGADHGGNVAGGEAGLEGIDADASEHAGERWQRLARRLARGDLLVFGDRILEVEDHGVGARSRRGAGPCAARSPDRRGRCAESAELSRVPPRVHDHAAEEVAAFHQAMRLARLAPAETT